MDTPVFHLDGMGNRLLITILAITYVIVKHPLAVGAYPLVAALEWRGMSWNDSEWDRLAKRTTLITFLITSGLGALAAIGVWLTSMLVSPVGIGSLLRIFFWNWFLQGTVFMVEVVLISTYYWTWDRWQGRWKRWHLVLGGMLSLYSWITLAIIVSHFDFRMSTGSWASDSTLLNLSADSLYLPQLAFRTFFSLTAAGLFVWCLIVFLVDRTSAFRVLAIRFCAVWTAIFSLPCLAAAFWFWIRAAAEVPSSVPLGLFEQKFVTWQSQFMFISVAVVGLMLSTSLLGGKRPHLVPRFALVTLFLMAGGWLVHFERVREFVRKPFIVAGYMYSNGVRVDELALLQHEGVLAHSVYGHINPIVDSNRSEAGQYVFLITCTQCHTTNGMHGVVGMLEHLYGDDPWDPKQIEALIGSMHTTRSYMPPFPGNSEESRALAAYLCELQLSRNRLHGAQEQGVKRFEIAKVESDLSDD